jgi:AcrR family transcriptional regulator
MAEASRQQTRERIVEVAAQLLRERGAGAVTTRAVAQAAGVQAPTLYRFFEDKDALLDAVAEHVFATYVTGKARTELGADPVADLRAGWEAHIAFGLANAPLFGLLADPARGTRSAAVAAGLDVLRGLVGRVAAAGRLRVPEERAVELLHAGGSGAVLTLLSRPPQDREPALADAMYDAIAAVILTDPPARPAANGAVPDAVTLRAVAPTLPMLSPAERALLVEWLERPG